MAERHETAHELVVGHEHAKVHRDRLHDERRDVAMLELRLELVERVAVERRRELLHAGEVRRELEATDATRADRVAVIGLLERHELVATRELDRELERDL